MQCIVDNIYQSGEQSPANITKGYRGLRETTAVPLQVPFFQNAMCPVNVHWHLGAEHYSLDEYDETGSGPPNNAAPSFSRLGYQCKFYNETDTRFSTAYDWQHCLNMEVGQTYEVHFVWSAAGACGTVNQYQTPFLDGMFCLDDIITDTASQLGMQVQVFTVVNDEAYYYPDLLRGMLVDDNLGLGTEVTKYTGSTTGTSRNNEICSQYTPITMQVDRKCHLISASSFDKLCADMKAQSDDMWEDLFPHGSRELVDDELAANNQVQ